MTLTVVLYYCCMRVSTVLGGKRRFEVYEQIPLLAGGCHTGLLCEIQLEKDTMMKRSGGMLTSADTSKDLSRMLQFG